jgi:hypothetical protein
MKNLFFLLCLISFALSCRKKEPTTPANFITGELGTITGLTANGLSLPRKDMTLEIKAIKSNICNPLLYDIEIRHKTPNSNAFVESFGFSKLPYGKTGKFPLIHPTAAMDCDTVVSSSFLMLDGGDVVIGIYIPQEKTNNYVQIESFDKNTGEVTGTFDIIYKQESSNALARSIYPGNIHFEKARFKLKVP